MARQVEVADDLGPQQRDDVGADRELEAGEDLFGDRGAAEHVPPLEDEHLLPGPREVGGVDEAVVPAADDDDVVLRAHASLRPPSIVTPGFVRRPCRERASILIIARSRQGPCDSAFIAEAGAGFEVDSADRDRRTRENVSALREPELPRVVGLLRRQRLRGAPRARVQRDPQRRGADRHLAALQVPARPARTRRGWSTASSRATCGRSPSGWSSTRPGATSTARSSTTARSRAWRRTPTAGRRPTRACAGSSRTRSASTSTIEDISERGRGARAAGADLGPAAEGGRRGRHREPQVLPGHVRQDRRRARRHLAHRLHGRPRLRDLDALEGRRHGLGRADGRRARPSTSTRPACSRSTWRASRRGCS